MNITEIFSIFPELFAFILSTIFFYPICLAGTFLSRAVDKLQKKKQVSMTVKACFLYSIVPSVAVVACYEYIMLFTTNMMCFGILFVCGMFGSYITTMFMNIATFLKIVGVVTKGLKGAADAADNLNKLKEFTEKLNETDKEATEEDKK